MASPLATAVELLERHYRWLEVEEPEGSWQQGCRVLLEKRGKETSEKKRMEEVWEGSCLASAEETATTSLAELQEQFGQWKLPEKSAGSVLGLARWWVNNVREDDPLLERWDDETLRRELRTAKGVSNEQADRIALAVFGRRVLPLNRTVVRVGCRHRWIGWEADDEEWQGLFQQGVREGDSSAVEWGTWLLQVGKDFCGPKPKCESCPLASLLPEGGPDEPLE